VENEVIIFKKTDDLSSVRKFVILEGKVVNGFIDVFHEKLRSKI